jgi:hypothetical protein
MVIFKSLALIKAGENDTMKQMKISGENGTVRF